MANVMSRLNLDRVGVGASALCAIHCLVTGMAFSVLPLIGLGFLGSPIVDIGMLSVAILIGGIALWSGFRRHRSRMPAVLYCTGLVSVIVAHFVLGHGTFDILSTILAVAGGLLLVSYHFLNMRLIRTAKVV